MANKKDWIDRDEDFVHRGGFRSGWDDEDDSNTDYILRGFLAPENSEAELREINKLCANRCNILAEEKNVVFSLNPNESTARTDGKRVKVGTGVLDEVEKTFSEKADIMVGLTTHEMAHVMFSKFKDLDKMKDEFHKSIMNVIEDERIEHLLTERFPGYAHSLAKVKKYFFEEKYLIEKALEDAETGISTLTEEEKTAMELFHLFFRFVRFPTEMDEEALGKHEIEIDEIKAALTPYPLSAKAALEASEQVYDIINRAMTKPPKPTPGPGDEAEEGATPSTGTSAPSPGSKEDEEEKESKVEAAKKIVAEMMKDFSSDNEPGAEIEVSPMASKIKFNEEFIYDPEWKATFRTGTPDKVRYEELASKIKGDSRRLAGSLFTKVFSETRNLRGMRSGALDDSRIVEACHGVKNVHIQTIAKETKKLNIVLMIDESGSMGSQGGDKVDNAASAGILIEKAFEVFPVGQLFIYGFTSDHNWRGTCDHNQILRYREPGLHVKHGLGDARGRSNNRDGECIRAVARRVRNFTQDPMLFFVISDGQPSASRYGGYHDTRQAVTEITKMKFFPIQIGIGDGLEPREQAQMFDEFVHYDDSKQMVDDLRKLILRKAHKIFGV